MVHISMHANTDARTLADTQAHKHARHNKRTKCIYLCRPTCARRLECCHCCNGSAGVFIAVTSKGFYLNGIVCIEWKIPKWHLTRFHTNYLWFPRCFSIDLRPHHIVIVTLQAGGNAGCLWPSHDRRWAGDVCSAGLVWRAEMWGSWWTMAE